MEEDDYKSLLVAHKWSIKEAEDVVKFKAYQLFSSLDVPCPAGWEPRVAYVLGI